MKVKVIRSGQNANDAEVRKKIVAKKWNEAHSAFG